MNREPTTDEENKYDAWKETHEDIYNKPLNMSKEIKEKKCTCIKKYHKRSYFCPTHGGENGGGIKETKEKIENWEKEVITLRHIECKKHFNRDITCEECNRAFEYNCQADTESVLINEVIKEAEKRGYEKGKQDQLIDAVNGYEERVKERARKEIIEEIEKWAKEKLKDSIEKRRLKGFYREYQEETTKDYINTKFWEGCEFSEKALLSKLHTLK